MSGTSTLVLEFRVDGTTASLQKVNQLQSGIEQAAMRMNATWASPLAGMSAALDTVASKLETGITRGFYASAAAAGVFAFAMAGVSRSFIEVNQKFAEFEITLSSSLKSLSAARAITDQVARVTATSPLPFKDIAESITGLSILPQLNKKFRDEAAEGMLGDAKSFFMRSKELVEMMSTFRPDKRPEEAVFSIREALSGQWRSILRRFDVPLSIFSDAAGGKSIGRITAEGPDAIFNSIYKAFANIISPEAVKKRSMMFSVALDNIYEQMFQIPALQVGRSGFMKNLGERLNKYLNDSMGFFNVSASGAPGDFQSKGYAQRMSDSLTKIMNGFLDGLSKAGNSILASFGYTDASKSIYERAAQAIADGLESFSNKLPGYIEETVKIGRDLLDLAKSLFEVFREIVSGFLSAYHAMQPVLGTGGAAAALYLAPSLISSGITTMAKGLLSTIGTAITQQFASAINPMSSLAMGQGFIETGAASGAVRLTPAVAKQMGLLGMSSAAGKAFRGGQVVAPNIAADAIEAAGVATPALISAAGLTAIASLTVALVGLAVTVTYVVKAIGAYKEMTDAGTVAEKTRLTANNAIIEGLNRYLATQNAIAALSGAKIDPATVELNRQRSIAEGQIAGYRATGSYQYLQNLSKEHGIEVPSERRMEWAKAGGTDKEIVDRIASTVNHIFTVAMTQLANSAKTAGLAQMTDYASTVGRARGFTGLEDRLDASGVKSAAEFTGGKASDTTRQLISGAFQDIAHPNQSVVMARYLSEIADETAAMQLVVDGLQKNIATGKPGEIMGEISKEFNALMALRGQGEQAILAAGFQSVESLDNKLGDYRTALFRGTENGLDAATNLIKSRIKTGIGAIADKNLLADQNSFFFRQDETAKFLASMAGTSGMASRRSQTDEFARLSKQAGFTDAPGIINGLKDFQSTLGMAPFQKLNAEVYNASIEAASLKANFVSLRDGLPKLKLSGEALSNAEDRVAKAEAASAAGADRLTVARQALADALKANTLQEQARLQRDVFSAFQTAKGQGGRFSTAFTQDMFAKNAIANNDDTGFLGFGKGFDSQFKKGADWKNMAQGGIDAANALKTSMTGAFTAMLEGTMSVKAGFKSMAVSVLQSIEQMIIKMIVLQIVESAIGFFAGGVKTGAASGSASYSNSAAFGATGGLVANHRIGANALLHFARGGGVHGGSGYKDDVPAMLMDGEYVLNKRATSMIGSAQLDAWNRGAQNRHYAAGGYVGNPGGGANLVNSSVSASQVNVVVNYNSGSSGGRDEQNTGSTADESKARKQLRQEIEIMVVKTVEKHERMMKAQQN